MEKFVVDAESKQVSKPRAPSPTASLPNSWRYSSNIRAPPPLAYNPLLVPFYPPAAAKQPPSTSPKIKPKQTKQKAKPATKHLTALDIMKHQPYQLDTSLFKYEKVIETKTPSPKPSPTPTKSEPRKVIKHRSGPARSPRNISENKTTNSPVSADHQSTKTADVLTVDKDMDVKLSVSPVLNHTGNKQVASNRPASTTSQHSSISSISDSLAAAFSPASLIARGVRQMAPRPKFSAKKQALRRSRSMSLPWQLSVMSCPGGFPAPGKHASAALQRHTSIQEKSLKPPTPWEAASRSPIGSVDEAFMFPSGPSSIVSSVKAAGHRKSLPEPPEEWKRRVSLDPAPVTRGHYQVAPAFQAPAHLLRTDPYLEDIYDYLHVIILPASPLCLCGVLFGLQRERLSLSLALVYRSVKISEDQRSGYTFDPCVHNPTWRQVAQQHR
ncbi:hypothetical protein WMY93_013125 [Mugilogobius chulae]|uniref:Uncharacterized protein n=1 Tax=Mugilogobius chulae TaxID=88201 RepID=A0AAW0P571_9GOBI